MMIIQEMAVPKLSQTSLYDKFDKTNNIRSSITKEISNAKSNMVTPETLTEIFSLMKLNGDPLIKKAIEAYQHGDIVILFNNTSDIPMVLPYIVANIKGHNIAYIFANKVVTNIKAQSQYTNLMATLEAAYLNLSLINYPNKFIMNSQLMLLLCNVYVYLVITPLEQKLYIKGENLTKCMLYAITYFYRSVLGNPTIEYKTIPYRRFIRDKVDEAVIKQIFDEVHNMKDNSFISLLGLIKNINPVRYKDIQQTYLSSFTSSCGSPIMFALENLGYLFLLITSSEYKTQLTQYALNKIVGQYVKKIIATINQLNLK